MCWDCYDPNVIVTCDDFDEPDFSVNQIVLELEEELESYLWDYTSDRRDS